MSTPSQPDDKGRQALERIGEVVKPLKGLPRGIERRGIGYGWSLYDQVERDLDDALEYIGTIPGHGHDIVHLIYLLRELAVIQRREGGTQNG
ncbi:MAG TPA: hypothetical protein VF586_15860 [Pyrinomonadaceae bacterium]|jgi:hypothetical protein